MKAAWRLMLDTTCKHESALIPQSERTSFAKYLRFFKFLCQKLNNNVWQLLVGQLQGTLMARGGGLDTSTYFP